MPDCPSCGDPYELGASFCSYCAYALSLKPIPPAEPSGSIAKCTCGSRDLNKQKTRFCRFCGNSLLVKEPEGNFKDDWNSALALEKNEVIADTWDGEEKQIEPMNEGGVQVSTRGEGLLVLTNQELIWLDDLASTGESQYSIGFQIPLEKISDMSSGVKPGSHIAITDDKALRVVSLFSHKGPGFEELLQHRRYMTENELGIFQETVMKYRAERKFAVLELQKKERVQVVVDFSFLKDYMEKGGMVVQKISCANCGASMHLPEKENTVDCPYGRTTHRVQDVFERVKQLIG